MRPAVVRSGTLALALVLPAACAGQADGELPCRVYRPQLAKRTFDGRVGAALVFNAGARPVEVRVYHPDGAGDVERRWRVSAGRLLALSGDDGVRLSLGNDWGVQVDDGCVRTLGQSAGWRPGGIRADLDRRQPARRDRPGALTSATA